MTCFPLPTDKYVVSFNCMVAGIKVGDPYLRTLDMFSSSVKNLTDEVARDPRGYEVLSANEEGTASKIKAFIYKDGKIKGIMTTIEKLLAHDY